MFNITYDRITPESAVDGEAAESGFHREDVTLRDVVSEFGRRCCEDSGQWFSTIDPDRDYSDGSETYYAIHPPRSITPASYRRVRRILVGR